MDSEKYECKRIEIVIFVDFKEVAVLYTYDLQVYFVIYWYFNLENSVHRNHSWCSCIDFKITLAEHLERL